MQTSKPQNGRSFYVKLYLPVHKPLSQLHQMLFILVIHFISATLLDVYFIIKNTMSSIPVTVFRIINVAKYDILN